MSGALWAWVDWIGSAALFFGGIWFVLFLGFAARSRYGYQPHANVGEAAGCATAVMVVMVLFALLKGCH